MNVRFESVLFTIILETLSTDYMSETHVYDKKTKFSETVSESNHIKKITYKSLITSIKVKPIKLSGQTHELWKEFNISFNAQHYLGLW